MTRITPDDIQLAPAPRSRDEAAAGPAPEPGAPSRPAPAWLRPAARIAFWGAGVGALAAAGLALAASSAGWHGFVLLAGIASVAFLLLYALAAGEGAGRALAAPGRSERAESALARAALEAVADPVLVADARGRAIWANPAYHALARKAVGLGAALGAPTPDRVWPGSASAPIYRLARAAAKGESAREILPALDAEGPGFVAVVNPMDEGRAVWRFSEARGTGEDAPPAPDWSEHAPVGLFLADAEGRVLSANATLRRWTGAGADQALKLADFLAGDMAKTLVRTRGAQGVKRLDARMLAREGVETPVVVALEWDEARPPRMRGVVYGLSQTGAPPGVEQAIASQTAGRTGRTFDDMFASAPFGVARLDGVDPQDAIIEDSNPALVQFSAGAAIPGARFADLFDWSGEEDAEAVFAAALSGSGEPVGLSLKAGEDARDVHLFLAPARSGGRVAYIVDVSPLKALERQFAQAAKMQAVGQLASGVAHDFNNMLTVINLNTDMLLASHPVGDPSYFELQRIRSTVARARGMVRKLLAFSRKQTLRTETVDVTDAVSDCGVLLRQILEEWVRLDIRHGRDLPFIKVDRTELDNAIVNLATNARDAMREQGGGALTVTTEALDAEAVRAAGATDPRPGPWAAIHVADEGTGMDEDTLAKIFEPFFTTKPAGQGTGLGLATVYGIVKQFGGYLFARSEVGKGTTFSIYLPGHAAEPETDTDDAAEDVPDRRPAPAAPDPAPADMAGRGRILFVEDEVQVREIAAKLLVKRGYEVVEACDGEEALEILEDEPGGFDLIISDVMMPGLNGPAFLEKAGDKIGEARIIFISGYAEEEFSQMLSSAKGVSFLPKPFSLSALAAQVKEQLSK